MFRWSAAFLGFLTTAVLLAAAPAAPQRSPALQALGAKVEAERFEAALRLVEDPDPEIDAALEAALASEPFRASARAGAAARFVLTRRRGPLPEAPAPQRPNLLLVSIDTLRADRLGCYGHDRPTSPTLDALAANGALFTQAASTSSWTLPAHMSMFTSLYPAFHKLERGGRLGTSRLDDHEATLAELLHAAGYATAGFVAHPFLSGSWGFDRGFELYRRYETRADVQTARARLWLEWHAFHAAQGLAPAPFFLFVHYIDPHETYDPPGPYAELFTSGYAGSLRPTDHLVTLFQDRPFENQADRRYVQGLYDGEIRFVDDNLSGLLDGLRALGQEGHTVVAVTSDHGEEFHEHDSTGHKQTLYEEQLRVPLIVAQPGRIAAGQRIERPVSLVDLGPTLLELVGAPPRAHAQGRSLVPDLSLVGAPARSRLPESPAVFAELGPLGRKWEGTPYLKTARDSQRKLIYSYDVRGVILERELYALDRDPGERRNLYPTHRGEPAVQALEARLQAFAKAGREYRASAPDQNAFEIDSETLERLKSLGYVD